MQNKTKKILIVQYGSVSRLIMSSAVVRAVRQKFKDAHLALLTCPQGQHIYEANPYIDHIETINRKPTEKTLWALGQGFGLVVNLAGTTNSRVFSALLFTRSYYVSQLRFQTWFFLKFKPENLRLPHWVDWAFEQLKPLGIKADTAGLDYFIPHRDKTEKGWLPAEFDNGYAVFIIGGRYNTRKLPTQRLIELCGRINLPIVLIGGKEAHQQAQQVVRVFNPQSHESQRMQQLIDEVNQQTVVFNACGLFNLNQSASLIQKSEGVFSYDTGLMHAAAAFGKTIYTIWGSSSPMLGRYPYRTRFITYQTKGLKCRPCHLKGHSSCPLGHFKCMNDIKFEFKY